MGRRTLLLVASILVAAVGTALIFLYVRGADQRATQGAALVKVVVTTKDVAQGQTVKQAFADTSFDLKAVPRDLLLNGVFVGDAGLNELKTSGDKAALANIPKNMIVVASAFGSAGAATASGIARGKVAVSMQLSDPNRVAGLLKPGTMVAVVVTTDPESLKELGATVSGGSQNLKGSFTAALMTDAKVISVGSTGQSGGGETVDPKIIAVEVDPEQALEIRAGEKVGELSLAILGKDAKFPVFLPPQIVPLGFPR